MRQAIHRVIDLVEPESQQILNMSRGDAQALLLDRDSSKILSIEGSFALVAREGETVRLARSLDRPLRYFLAKEKSGPLLVVADRIDQIQRCLEAEGFAEQFHPSYTRMVPAHHVTTLQLIGCPDPNPVYDRFVEPAADLMPADLDLIGRQYVGVLRDELARWLRSITRTEPLGVLFSGGVDSGAVLVCLYHLLLQMGQRPARLKAFTLAVDGAGGDAAQAREFLRRLELEFLGEIVEVDAERVDPFHAIEVIEDYKPRDVECAAVNLALLEQLRETYPDWRYLIDGDGGDENLKDYPIEENPELTIRSVVSNPLLYQEGWGVDRIKHSLTYSGGQSRGCVRTYGPARRFGFIGFSPCTRPAVVEMSTRIPFDALTRGSHQSLYALKGEIMSRGIRALFDLELPVFEKRRFQEGATSSAVFSTRFTVPPESYREHFLELHRR